MNLELLKKLTRLANKNPNEHEANLAARKVCKMLEEGDWKLSPAPKVVSASNPFRQNDFWEDLMRGRGKYEPPRYQKPPEPTVNFHTCIRCRKDYPAAPNEAKIKNFICASCQAKYNEVKYKSPFDHYDW